MNWYKQITVFYESLVERNKTINLTRITTFDSFIMKHIADSLLAVAVIPEIFENGFNVADIGCGPGFPGIPLALTFPKSSFTEIDSSTKKNDFTTSIIAGLKLANCRAIQGRARELSRLGEFKWKYDLVLARAVKDTAYLVRECRDFICRRNGKIVVYKTPKKIQEEQVLAKREVQKFKLSYQESPVYELPDNLGKRQFCIISAGGLQGNIENQKSKF